MTKRQRIAAALRGEATDRVPVSIYQHSTVHDRGVEPFVDYTLRFHRAFDPDYVKVMYDELYDAPVNFQFVTDSSVWDLLVDLDPHRGGFGRYLQSLERIRDAVDADTPVIATVFTPLHLAIRLAWTRLKEDCRADEARTVRGIGAIARNLCAFVKAAREEAGVDGFFLGGYGTEPGWLQESDYRRIAAPFDRAVVAAMRPSPLIIAHAHGEQGSYFGLLETYDCDALSWEDRHGGPSLGQARARTRKCLVGGVDHAAARTSAAASVRAEALDAIAATGGRGLILAPGCTFPDGTPAENMRALKAAAEEAAAR